MRPTRTFTLVAAVALLLGTFAGCNRTKPPYRVSEDPYGRQQVYVADSRLAGRLEFGGPRVSYDEADLMHISLDVRAADNRRQIVQYRTHFFDRTGQELYVTQWQTRTLESNVQETLTSNATTPQADSFQIDIRTAE